MSSRKRRSNPAPDLFAWVLGPVPCIISMPRHILISVISELWSLMICRAKVLSSDPCLFLDFGGPVERSSMVGPHVVDEPKVEVWGLRARKGAAAS